MQIPEVKLQTPCPEHSTRSPYESITGSPSASSITGHSRDSHSSPSYPNAHSHSPVYVLHTPLPVCAWQFVSRVAFVSLGSPSGMRHGARAQPKP